MNGCATVTRKQVGVISIIVLYSKITQKLQPIMTDCYYMSVLGNGV